MRRVAVLTYDYPPNDGGISRLASAVTEEIARRGIAVEVLTRAMDGRLGPRRPAVPTREIAWTIGRRDWETWHYLRQLPPGVPVLATLWNPEATLAWLAYRGPRFVMAHGNEVMRYPRGLRLAVKKELRRLVLSSAQAVICNSRYTERLVRAIEVDARTEVICPAVDAQRFGATVDRRAVRARLGLPLDRRLVLSVSRLSAYKGHDVVLDALGRLPVSARDRLHYAVAGKGEQLVALQRKAAELRVDQHVSWLGFVSEEELPELYGAADLFILCTREDRITRGVEGFGMVYLEAQAAGVPVLGTRAGGIPDAICDGQGGWLVGQDDADAVARHLARLAEEPWYFEEQGRIGRARVQREATWKGYVDRLLEVMGHTRA